MLDEAGADRRRSGHGGHVMTLERAVACFPEPGRLRRASWFETWHGAQVVVAPAHGG